MSIKNLFLKLISSLLISASISLVLAILSSQTLDALLKRQGLPGAISGMFYGGIAGAILLGLTGGVAFGYIFGLGKKTLVAFL